MRLANTMTEKSTVILSEAWALRAGGQYIIEIPKHIVTPQTKLGYIVNINFLRQVLNFNQIRDRLQRICLQLDLMNLPAASCGDLNPVDFASLLK
jgi:hypothetical protein